MTLRCIRTLKLSFNCSLTFVVSLMSAIKSKRPPVFCHDLSLRTTGLLVYYIDTKKSDIFYTNPEFNYHSKQ